MLKALIKRITDYLNHQHEWVKVKEIELVDRSYGPEIHVGYRHIYQCSDTSCSKIRKVRI